MLSLAVFLSAFILFFILSPGVLLRLPPKGHKFTVAIVHAIVFSVLFSLVLMVVQKVVVKEGLQKTECRADSKDTSKNVFDDINHKYVPYGSLPNGANCVGPQGSCYHNVCGSKKCNPSTGKCIN